MKHLRTWCCRNSDLVNPQEPDHNNYIYFRDDMALFRAKGSAPCHLANASLASTPRGLVSFRDFSDIHLGHAVIGEQSV